jgi:hypothetical protein
MVDAFSLLVSHGMLVFVIWRLMVLRDPEDRPDIRLRPTGKGRPGDA